MIVCDRMTATSDSALRKQLRNQLRAIAVTAGISFLLSLPVFPSTSSPFVAFSAFCEGAGLNDAKYLRTSSVVVSLLLLLSLLLYYY